MRILILGAGPLGTLYAHRLHASGAEVRLLARGARKDWLMDHGLVLHDAITGEDHKSSVPVVDAIDKDDAYDLALVVIRKNRLQPILELLASRPKVKRILFLGNNASRFAAYRQYLEDDRLMFGFPGAGGGVLDQVVHFADRDSAKAKRHAVTLGTTTPAGVVIPEFGRIRKLFEDAGIPVAATVDIDGWLKYHVAQVLPLACVLLQHDADPAAAAEDAPLLRQAVRAAKEAGHVLRALGYRKRQPFRFNLFYWLPEAVGGKALQRLLSSRFAEVAFAMHARAAGDEMRALSGEFRALIEASELATPAWDSLTNGLS